MIMNWDNPQFKRTRSHDGWTLEIDGSNRKWPRWFADQNSDEEWLSYSGRNAIHAFDLLEDCNQAIQKAGLVTVWARSTSRDNEQATRFCRSALGLEGSKRGRATKQSATCICGAHNLNGWQWRHQQITCAYLRCCPSP